MITIDKEELFDRFLEKAGTTTDPRNTYKDMLYIRISDVSDILDEVEEDCEETRLTKSL